MDRYAATGDTEDLTAASFFWDRVARHHSFATGGHGKDEYFGEPDRFNDRIDGRTAESCNVYNMLKLTRRLFSYHPAAGYADFRSAPCSTMCWVRLIRMMAQPATWCRSAGECEREYADMFGEFHLLRGQRHGKPRPARRWHLL